ncbi:MAG TPA: PAS domain-containing sensor histidine kinase [Alphaproteobacteria bacterium]|nr:PAS domain-containing sensor histidine kinase [Alphaproteobacteria bacterium]
MDLEARSSLTAATAGVSVPLGRRLADWAHRHRLSRKLAILLAAAAVASGIATYAALTGSGIAPAPGTVLLLLNLDLVLLLALGAVVARRIVLLWVERRRGSAGSKLHVQLVMLFSALAVAPAIVMALFSALFFNLGVEAWFSQRVQVALNESLAVAQAYISEHRELIRGDILEIASNMNRQAAQLDVSPHGFQQLAEAASLVRKLPEVVVFDDKGHILAAVNRTDSHKPAPLPLWALDEARAGDVVIFNPDDAEGLTAGLSDRVRAVVKLEAFDNVFLMIGRFVDPQAIGHYERTNEAVRAYQSIEGQRSGLQITFAIIFVVVAVLLLLAAVWVGLMLANRLARPIAELVGAAERVRSGDFKARVDETKADGEIGSLSRAFNRMTSQLEAQRRELMEANRQMDDRRRFTEAVLTGVSSGVIGLDAGGQINLPNRAASTLLSTDLAALVGKDFRAVVPEMAALVDTARADAGRPAEGQITVVRGGRRRSLLVRVGGQPLENGALGFVVTFDDITELEAAQRKAAWSDVARRIAHEIKNPLTPIQLSAERLKRKYAKEITSDPETFRICTETIVRQVGDIGRMVDEFSSFARMPAPSMREDDLSELIRQTVFLQRNARPEITFETQLPQDGPVRLVFDPRQIGQALTNLLKNAAEAIDGRPQPESGELAPGRISVRLIEDADRTSVVVEDNGKGLPVENRERLTEPYVTTRSKGTGLGLAIVKKIMEDHGGELTLDEAPDGGARVSLIFLGRVRKSRASPPHDAAPELTKATVHGA